MQWKIDVFILHFWKKSNYSISLINSSWELIFQHQIFKGSYSGGELFRRGSYSGGGVFQQGGVIQEGELFRRGSYSAGGSYSGGGVIQEGELFRRGSYSGGSFISDKTKFRSNHCKPKLFRSKNEIFSVCHELPRELFEEGSRFFDVGTERWSSSREGVVQGNTRSSYVNCSQVTHCFGLFGPRKWHVSRTTISVCPWVRLDPNGMEIQLWTVKLTGWRHWSNSWIGICSS